MLQNDDNRLGYEVERAIGLLPELDLRDLRVSVDRGRARIQGVVGSAAHRQAAIDAAAGIEGIVYVDDAIAVESHGAEAEGEGLESGIPAR
jgi:osmotically-inducible protein OsmY